MPALNVNADVQYATLTSTDVHLRSSLDPLSHRKVLMRIRGGQEVSAGRQEVSAGDREEQSGSGSDGRTKQQHTVKGRGA